jgi:phage terminase large subunit-like protein
MGRRRVGDRDYCAVGKRYAQQVVEGKIPACRLVQLACQRQIDDLGRKRWHWRFDKERGNRVCKFIERLPHIKGRWKTRTIQLEPWQCFLLTVIFGWVDADGFRRYRKAYVEVPRKNAKTTICAGIALFLLCGDGEPGAEVYSAAVTRDQAKISWDIARQMVKTDPEMQAFYGVEPLAHSIAIPSQAASFKPLSRDADSLEGLNPHGAIIDELHAHKTREVFDVINLATGSRRQSLIVQITTAGDNKAGVCYEQHDYVEQILTGRHDDDRYFGIIYTIDPEEDWTTAEAARKANPNYGVSVLADDIETICRQAQASAESQNTFLTKRLNIWVSVGTAYFNMLAWDHRCKDSALKVEDFYGRECRIHLDLASKKDLTSKLMYFELGDGFYAIFGKYYLPEDAVERGCPNYDIYRGWARGGLLTLTPGNVTDYEFIERDVLDDMRNFSVREVIYDPFQATYLVTRLQAASVKMVEFPMTVQRYSGPMKEVEADIISGKLRHNGDLVLGWMMGNVVARKDAKDNVFPRKTRDEHKIDAAIGVIAARGRSMADRPVPSVYETRGILML